MSDSFKKDWQEPVETSRSFEEAVAGRLSQAFNQVERHARITGYSGIRWNVDFLVDSRLIVEASIQKRLETKINSTFLRLVDLTRANPGLSGALVVDKMHVLLHRARGKKYFPTSEYRTFLSFGFPIITLNEFEKLVTFHSSETPAARSASLPIGFDARSVLAKREKLGKDIFDILSRGPLKSLEIAHLTGHSRSAVYDAIKSNPEIKRVSIYYGLHEDEICKFILKNGAEGTRNAPLVREWVRRSFLAAIEKHGTYRTVVFADDMAVSRNAFGHLIHELEEQGLIERVSRGTWKLPGSDGHTAYGA